MFPVVFYFVEIFGGLWRQYSNSWQIRHELLTYLDQAIIED